MHRAVFVDRDGVICRNRDDHVKSWSEFEFLPGALRAMARLSESGLRIVIITNQAVINRRMVSIEVVEDIHARMLHDIELAGGHVDRVLYCPHRPDEQCSCRKPQPGMLLKAAEELNLDLCRSYLIGDAESDIRAGQAVGCRCYLVLSGRGTRQLISSLRRSQEPFTVRRDLRAAVNAILRGENGKGPHLPRWLPSGKTP
jgi:D-glycero-D-manno-heptose 1,7-bisphosphate phosphatase